MKKWEIFKRQIDGDPELFAIFGSIRDAAVEMRAALIGDDWDAVAEIMRAAYANRKRLAPNITTPHMDHLVEKALGNRALAATVCGAGRGGCIACFRADGRELD